MPIKVMKITYKFLCLIIPVRNRISQFVLCTAIILQSFTIKIYLPGQRKIC